MTELADEDDRAGSVPLYREEAGEMISAWNLLWIVPLSAMFGILVAALILAGEDDR